MIIQPEYKRDMHKNYLILSNHDGTESYDMKMVGNNCIPGLLKVELRNVDEQQEYCYDITSRQPLSILFRKDTLKEEQIKTILRAVIGTLAKGKEYLLLEDNFIIAPDYIYMSLEKEEIQLVYFSGYRKDAKEQLMSLIEYMMDKVDYQDKPAVFLIYGIYKISREELCTYEKLLAFLEDNNQLEEELERQERTERDVRLEEENTKDMEVEIETEEEEKKYPLWVWAACAGSVLAALLIVIVTVRSGILFDVVTGKLLLGKVAAVLGVVGALEAYCLLRVLDEKNKIAHIVKKTKYVKPVEVKGKTENPRRKEELEWEQEWKREWECEGEWKDKQKKTAVDSEQATTVLAAREEEYYLLPENSEIYMPIYFPEFPFFIGTLKTKVDGVINSRNVSRFHAKFEKRGKDFFLTDLNSTNGTFLNGVRLGASESREIAVGDYVSFADVSYRFCKR